MQITITFSKLGRGDDVPAPLVLEEADYLLPGENRRDDYGYLDWNRIERKVEDYSRQKLKSREVDTSIVEHTDTGVISGVVIVGGMRPVGAYTVVVADA